jgi:hypothetical protein
MICRPKKVTQARGFHIITHYYTTELFISFHFAMMQSPMNICPVQSGISKCSLDQMTDFSYCHSAFSQNLMQMHSSGFSHSANGHVTWTLQLQTLPMKQWKRQQNIWTRNNVSGCLLQSLVCGSVYLKHEFGFNSFCSQFIRPQTWIWNSGKGDHGRQILPMMKQYQCYKILCIWSFGHSFHRTAIRK